MEKATFAAGCFWHVEEDFRKVKGVVDTKVGYTGGKMKKPSYEDVCTDATGHAEAIEITYDPKIVSYEKLLDIFWMIHDPTSLNRQWFGTVKHWRSVIFYNNEKQKETALKSKERQQKILNKQIVTEIVKAPEFYPAEEYHQKYLMKRGKNTC